MDREAMTREALRARCEQKSRALALQIWLNCKGGTEYDQELAGKLIADLIAAERASEAEEIKKLVGDSLAGIAVSHRWFNLTGLLEKIEARAAIYRKEL